MRSVRLTTLYAAVLVGVFLPRPSSAQFSAGGKNVQILAENLTYDYSIFPGIGVAETTITFPKGLPGHVVVLEVNGRSTGPGFCDRLVISNNVNGVTELLGITAHGNPPDPALICCGATATYLAVHDLDKLESLVPGAFLGQPLELRILANTHSGDTCAGATIVAAAQLIKK